MMKGLRLYKWEKLCSRTDIERLFAEGRPVKAFPLRAVVRLRPIEEGEVPQARFLISIPKKKHRKAVARVLLRRRVREAYRLHRRRLLLPALETARLRADIAFLFLSDALTSYSELELRMISILTEVARMATSYKSPDDAPHS